MPPQAGVQPWEGDKQQLPLNFNLKAIKSSKATAMSEVKSHLADFSSTDTSLPLNSVTNTDSNTHTTNPSPHTNSIATSNNLQTDHIYPTRGTQVILMADLGVGASDDSTDTKVFSEACLPAFNTTNSIGHRVFTGETDAVLLSGDLSYANGYLSNWEFFLDTLSPITGKH